ncbi:MAG: alpha/beta hydrolase [Bacteroidota bacterium]
MQDWKYPYEVQQVVVLDSIEIAYVEAGAGDQTLLFVHGLGSNLKAWQKNMDALKDEFRCIALDLPGYGKSSKGDYTFEVDFFAQTIHQFIDSLSLQNVTLIGHSMGGQIAMRTVLQDNKRIDKLILIAPAGFETFSEKEQSWFQNFVTPTIIKATPEKQITQNFYLNFHVFPEDAQFMIDDRFAMRTTEEYDYYCEMIPKCVMGMLNGSVRAQLSAIETPTLILFGENDRLIPNAFFHPDLTTLKVAQIGDEVIPNSKLAMIPKAGHFVQWEQAELVNPILRNFLKR